VEGELQLRLPPPVPVANTERPPEQIGTDEGQASANTLMISIMAGPNGSTSAIQVANDVYRGPASQANLHQLDRRLRDVFGFAGTPFDQVLIRVAPGLKYEDLMKVIDVCTRQKMADGTRVSKLSFVELPEAPGAGE
jgi:biopolymer transport protein ExbD